MKKLIRSIAIVAMLVVCLIALTGCGKPKGKYVISSMTSGDTTVDASQLEKIRNES